jgi:maleylacetoacetate isomerase
MVGRGAGSSNLGRRGAARGLTPARRVQSNRAPELLPTTPDPPREVTMKLYGFWRSLAAFRVRIVLNLKGQGFDEVSIDILQGRQFDPAYRALNPLAVVPALDDGQGEPMVESLAICEYLDECFPSPPLLPQAPRERARVRALAQMIACDAHPLIVPRVRKYLAAEYAQDDAGVNRWCQHWFDTASAALERMLAGSPATGRYCHGDRLSLADVCLVSHVVGSVHYFKCDMAPFPTVMRIANDCLRLEAFARAHPLRQPGAPAAL